MTRPIHQKVTASHLRRDAYLYVRRATVLREFENAESTRRQYALRERAEALGWPVERVHVIDCDMGKSGATSANREGFQKLVDEVGMGRAGIVLAIDVSRLTRNVSDWHRLLEICARTDTLILDEDGIYSTGDFNDRLLLGLQPERPGGDLREVAA
jgi:DNA invertase Pin-like site-specific DNA recombinase